MIQDRVFSGETVVLAVRRRAHMSRGPILIVEDDHNIATLVATYLDREGFKTIIAHDGERALELFRRQQPRFVILDLMLPKVDGWTVCREIRAGSQVPILMLTARGEEVDRLLGFSHDVDDYVVKPFSPREVAERVKAILRRVGQPDRAANGQPLTQGGLILEPDKHRLTLHGREVPLTPSEFRLLEALMSAPGRVYTREELLGRLHSRGEVVIDRVVDVHIGKLRQKIEDDPARPRRILTVRGIGYRFAEPQTD
jgi:DNA-binding response OmpR family regulator